ncbi:MAG: hypothetical protein R3281_16340 [Balneolaceae bacterium]|nr:hypothetical protein [Balneolaceae bacterium]
MYKFLSVVVFEFIISVGFVSAGVTGDNHESISTECKIGAAKNNITPDQHLWVNGYGFRDHPSEGILQPLWINALAPEDADGRQAVMVTAQRNMEPALLNAGNGVARFAVNRRNNEEGELEPLTELTGPADRVGVPVPETT